MDNMTDAQKQSFLEWVHTWDNIRLADQALKLKKLLNTPDMVESILVDFASDLFDLIRDECVIRVATLGNGGTR